MTNPRIVSINGSLSAPSRTQLLIDAVTKSLARRISINVQSIELSNLAPTLSSMLGNGPLPGPVAATLNEISQADLLIAASPIYKASYSGLFKHLFDLLDPEALVGKPVLLLATGGSERHTLAIDHSFRPLFAFFRANALPSGVYATSSDFEQGSIRASGTLARIEEATSQAAEALATLKTTHLTPA